MKPPKWRLTISILRDIMNNKKTDKLSKKERSKISTKSSLPKHEKTSVFLWDKFLLYLPIIFVIGVLPLIVKLKPVPLGYDAAKNWVSDVSYDFFSYYKSVCLIVCSVVAVLLIFITGRDFKFPKGRIYKIIFASIAVYILFSLVSAIFSSYKDVSWHGAPDRCEGMISLICYAVIFFSAYVMFCDIVDFRYVFFALACVLVGITILGATQYFGHDFFKTDFGKSLILPKSFLEGGGEISFSTDRGKIYGTMFHYNYIGSFAAMTTPFFLTCALFLKDKKFKTVSMVLTACSLFVLFGSTARSGIVGLFCAFLMFLAVFIRSFTKNKKVFLYAVSGVVFIAVIFSVVTGGEVFARIPSLLADISLFGKSDPTFDYHDHIPIKNISLNLNTMTFQLQNGDILRCTGNKADIKFFDKDMVEVNYTKSSDDYLTTEDLRYKDFKFLVGTMKLNDKDEKTEKTYGVLVNYANMPIFTVYTNPETWMMYSLSMYPLDYTEAPYIGFKGKEKIGSGRGYIWSRSLPLLKNTFIKGYGPDTFFMDFPQGDLLAKWYTYETPVMTVDKAHNWYLQTAVNQGLISVFALILMLFSYIFDSFRLYALKSEYRKIEIVGAAISIAVAGYMGAGMFNDSVLSVAPIFWALFGTGVAINVNVSKMRLSNEN